MRSIPVRLVSMVLALAVAYSVYMLLQEPKMVQDWEMRKANFQEAAQRAQPLILAISTFTSASGHPPKSLDDIIPGYLAVVPETGIRGCETFEYRSLAHKQGSIVWYDLGSRQGQPYTGESRYNEGDPDHAILVFSLDSGDRITNALIDRMPKERDPEEFEVERWKAGGDRIGMALALSETYRLHGMPKEVFESLLGPPDGRRAVRGTPWELRINCPTGLLNHDTFVYWPTEAYPQQLYGGETESVGRWVYVHT